LAAKPDPFRIACAGFRLRGRLALDRTSVRRPRHARLGRIGQPTGLPADLCRNSSILRFKLFIPGVPAHLLITRNALNQNVFE
jgi:hypothetical protein